MINMCLGFHFPMNYMEGVQVDFEKLSTLFAFRGHSKTAVNTKES